MFILHHRVIKLTQCGKQIDSIVRQIAERITEVAVQHAKFVCLDVSSGDSVEKLIVSINADDLDSDVISCDKRNLSSGLSEWNVFMDDVWRSFCNTCPAGLARQMYTRIVAETIVHIVHITANPTFSGDNEIGDIR